MTEEKPVNMNDIDEVLDSMTMNDIIDAFTEVIFFVTGANTKKDEDVKKSVKLGVKNIVKNILDIGAAYEDRKDDEDS